MPLTSESPLLSLESLAVEKLYSLRCYTSAFRQYFISYIAGAKASFRIVRIFSSGLSRGWVVYLPLIVLLLYSVISMALIDRFTLIVLFGLGTTLSPILLLCVVGDCFLNKAPLFKKWMPISGVGNTNSVCNWHLTNALTFTYVNKSE